jgi:hypothetical protein
MANDANITFRVPVDAIRRAERLVPALQGWSEYLGMRIGSATVRRLAFLRGLAVIEEEEERKRRKRRAARRRRQ